jgi:hypothetical protein
MTVVEACSRLPFPLTLEIPKCPVMDVNVVLPSKKTIRTR